MWTCEHHLKCQNNHQHDCGHPRKEEEEEEEEEEEAVVVVVLAVAVAITTLFNVAELL